MIFSLVPYTFTTWGVVIQFGLVKIHMMLITEDDTSEG